MNIYLDIDGVILANDKQAAEPLSGKGDNKAAMVVNRGHFFFT